MVKTMLNEFFIKIVSLAINRYIALDPSIRPKLAGFCGKLVRIDVTDLAKSFLLTFSSKGEINLSLAEIREADLILQGKLIALSELVLGEPQQYKRRLVLEELKITGELELAQLLQQIFDEIDIDWEEHLSKLTGDMVAHQLANWMSSMKSWCQESRDASKQNMLEFLQEEYRLSPVNEALIDFYADIDVLRNDVERLSVRVKHLVESVHKE